MTDFLITAPLHEETRGKIVTRCFGNTDLRIRWCAFRDGSPEDEPTGYGDTEAQATAHLLELERR